MGDLGFRGILQSASVVGTGMIFSKGISLLAETIVARELSTAGFGAAIFAYTILVTAGSIAVIGIPQGFTYYLSIFDERGDNDAAFGTLVSGVAILVVIISIATFTLYTIPFAVVEAVGISRNQWRWVRLLGPLLVAYPVTQVSFGIMRGYDKSLPKVLSDDIVNKIFACAALSVAVLQNAGELAFLSFYLGQYLLSSLFASGYVLYLLRVKFQQITLRANFGTEGLQLVSYSWPLALKNGTRQILGSTDILLVGALLASSSAVGYYRVGYVISQVGMIPLLALTYLYTPRVARKHDNNKKIEMRNLYRQATKWSTLLTLPLLATVLYFPNDIIRILFGSEYTPGSVVLAILAFDVVLRSGMGTAASTLQAINRTKVDFVTTATTTIINLGLSYLLTLQYGIVGAAIGTLMSIFLMNSIQVLLVYRFASIQPFSKEYVLFLTLSLALTLPVFTVATTIFGGLRLTPLQVPVSLPAFGFGFVAFEILLAWFSGLISSDEKESISEFGRRYLSGSN
ncbi:flippase [Haloarcula sebkhae]|uniref:Flippase n=1 Tax=Haloarcula sebkhae TaxID=932660 RepID=A0ACC6VIT5_9EURY|nr:flippase [Haloarcula sebkhae]